MDAQKLLDDAKAASEKYPDTVTRLAVRMGYLEGTITSLVQIINDQNDAIDNASHEIRRLNLEMKELL